MKDLIKSILLEFGFDIVSFVSPFALEFNSSLKSRYNTWLGYSFHGSMDYLNNYMDKRFKPSAIDQNVKSIIMVGMSYFNSSIYELPSEEYGKVSMYAWGLDYHFVIKKFLNEVVERLKKELGTNFSYRIFSDSAPIYEKGFAMEGSLGFQGKNTCIINKKLGSFFFIGEILTDLEIEADEKDKFRGCGNCINCVVKCPTGALREYVLDSRKCISYLTIEYKGMIPENLALKMGSWIFGCDVCQEVCPFNKYLYVKKMDTKIREFYCNLTPFLRLKDVMEIPSNNQFRKIFKGKSILRAGRRGLIRNAIIVAVNNSAKKLKDEIYKLSSDRDKIVSETAKWALEVM
ncbi:MAG: tRNA epoxyqueuosine(34) reductase QueG [Brevinematia bacterium]